MRSTVAPRPSIIWSRDWIVWRKCGSIMMCTSNWLSISRTAFIQRVCYILILVLRHPVSVQCNHYITLTESSSPLDDLINMLLAIPGSFCNHFYPTSEFYIAHSSVDFYEPFGTFNFVSFTAVSAVGAVISRSLICSRSFIRPLSTSLSTVNLGILSTDQLKWSYPIHHSLGQSCGYFRNWPILLVMSPCSPMQRPITHSLSCLNHFNWDLMNHAICYFLFNYPIIFTSAQARLQRIKTMRAYRPGQHLLFHRQLHYLISLL